MRRYVSSRLLFSRAAVQCVSTARCSQLLPRGCATASSSSSSSPSEGSPVASVAPLREAVARADYRRFCAEQSASLLVGVPTVAFVHYLERTRKSGPTTEEQLRDMGCFRFDGPRIVLEAEGDDSPFAYEDELRQLALSLPAEGVSGEEAKQLLRRALPTFSPKLVGVVTVREVFSRFPHLFAVVRGDDTWRVRPVVRKQHQQQQQQQQQPAGGAVDGLRRGQSGSEGSGGLRAVGLPKLIERIDGELLRAYAASAGDGAVVESSATRSSATPGDGAAAHTAPAASAWRDVEPLLRRIDPSLVGQVGSADWADVVASLPSFEIRATPLVRAARRLRAVHLLVDGDGLTAHHLDAIVARFHISTATSTATVMRLAATPALTADDALTPMEMPTYAALEAAAARLRHSHHIVLRDVVYVCCDAKAAMYIQHVARAVEFPDAEVFVLTPTREVCVSSWKTRYVENKKDRGGEGVAESAK